MRISPQIWFRTEATAFLALGLITAALVVAMHRRDRKDAAPLWWLAIAAVVALGLWWRVHGGGDHVSLDQIQAVQEGSTGTHVRIATGGAAHAGHGYTRFLIHASGPAPRELRDLIQMHHRFGAISAALVAIGTTAITRQPLVAALLTAIFVTNPLTRAAVYSAQPAMEIGPILALMALPLAACARRDARIDRLALAWLTLATGVIATLRFELAMLPAVVALFLAARMRFGEPALQTTVDGLTHRAAVTLAWVRAKPTRLLGMVVVAGATYPFVIMGQLDNIGRFRWPLAALHPYDPSLLAWPGVLWTFLPLGIAIMLVIAAIRTLLQPIATLGIGFSSLFLLRILFHAGHGSFLGQPDQASVFELQRYLMPLLPALLLAAAWGWTCIQGWPGRIAVMALAIVPAWPGASDASGLVTSLSIAEQPTNTQTEVRALVDLLDRYQDCRVVTHPGETHRSDTWTVFASSQWVRKNRSSPPVASWTINSDVTAISLLEAVDRAGPMGGCVLFWWGLGCSLTEPSDCQEIPRDALLLEELTFPNRSAVHPKHRVTPRSDEVTTRLYSLREADAEAQ